METTYNNLTDVQKLREQNHKLYDYLYETNQFDISKLFHTLTKEELVAKLKRQFEKDLKLIENL